MKAYCPECQHIAESVHPVGGKIAGALITGALGAKATKSVGGALVSALVGAAIGHVIDKEITPRCAICGTVLQIVAASL